jgi:uncharacterized protein (UPF0254 family)
MDSRELRILKEIEASAHEDDAAFAEMLAAGPRLSVGYKLGIGLATGVGLALLMTFPTNLLVGLVGYLLLVAVGTNFMRRRALKPVEDSPLEMFHRLTAGLLRNPDTALESSYE